MKIFLPFLILIIFTTISCSSVRESAGVNRKSIDEYVVLENPPLIIPPDFNLLPPDQLQAKKIEDIENELAEEILFGLDNNEATIQKKVSTMNNILQNTNALDSPNSIREEVNKHFANEINTKGIFQTEFNSEVEVLDALKESERIRNQNFDGKSIADGDVPKKKQIIKNKKKKRFFFF